MIFSIVLYLHTQSESLNAEHRRHGFLSPFCQALFLIEQLDMLMFAAGN
jgi:hypothetical protein